MSHMNFSIVVEIVNAARFARNIVKWDFFSTIIKHRVSV